MMSRRCLLVLGLLGCLVPALVSALGQDKPWFGGIYTQSSGYSTETGLPAAAWFGAGLFLEPFGFRALNPALAAGVLLPVSPFQAQAARLQVSAWLSLYDFELPLLKRTFYAALRWSPAVGAEYQLGLAHGDMSWALLAAPLRIRAGAAVVTLGEIQLFLRPEPPQGWGVGLFQAMLFLF